MTIVLIDTNVLGQIVSPNNNKSKEYLYQIYSRGGKLVTSDICDYEIRRNLIFIQINPKVSNKFKELSLKSIQNLNNLRTDGYVEFITTDLVTLQKASTIWAKTQILGIPLTNPEKLDVDSILCAHWEILSEENPGRRVIVATTNIRHLGNFVEAQEWLNIKI